MPVLAVFLNPPHSWKGQLSYLRCSPHRPQINGYPLASWDSGYPFHRLCLEVFTKLHILKRTYQRAVRALFEQSAPVWRNSICKRISPACEYLRTLGNLAIFIKTIALLRKDTNIVWPSHLATVLTSGNYAYFKSGYHANAAGHLPCNNAIIGKPLFHGFIRREISKFISSECARFLCNEILMEIYKAKALTVTFNNLRKYHLYLQYGGIK